MTRYSKCPCCGYYAFNGYECFDCGYRPNRQRGRAASLLLCALALLACCGCGARVRTYEVTTLDGVRDTVSAEDAWVIRDEASFYSGNFGRHMVANFRNVNRVREIR